MDLNEIKANISQIEMDFHVRKALYENGQCNKLRIIKFIQTKLKVLENLMAEGKKYGEHYDLNLYREMNEFYKKISKSNNVFNF